MKVIIAGGRDIFDPALVLAAIKESGFVITEVVCGKAPGIDTLGENWANSNKIPVKPFPADWNNLNVPNVRRKINSFGKVYNALAGHNRNEQMAQYAEALIAIWDGKSPGTRNMIALARSRGLKIYIKYV